MADDDAPLRLPIPNAEARSAADKQVRDIFQTEFAAAKRPAEKSALAEMLVRLAQNDGDDAVAQYALFAAARALAVEADEFQIAFSVTEELVARFELDTYELKAAVLTAGSKELRSVIADWGFCELIVEAVDDAASEEQFDAATKLVPLLSAAASKFKDALGAQRVPRASFRIEAASNPVDGNHQSQVRVGNDTRRRNGERNLRSIPLLARRPLRARLAAPREGSELGAVQGGAAGTPRTGHAGGTTRPRRRLVDSRAARVRSRKTESAAASEGQL